jgi:hypothetical protein
MPVVINEFEVTPAPQANENKTPDRKGGESSAAKKPEMSDYEVKQMLERRMERFERIAAR